MYSKLSKETYHIHVRYIPPPGDWLPDHPPLGEHGILRLKPKFNPPSTGRIDTILANMRGGRATDIHRASKSRPLMV